MFGCLRGLLKGPKIYKKNTKKTLLLITTATRCRIALAEIKHATQPRVSRPNRWMDGWMDGWRSYYHQIVATFSIMKCFCFSCAGCAGPIRLYKARRV